MTGAELRRLLEALQLTPEGFAEDIAVHRATVFRWLAGKVPAGRVRSVEMLAEVYRARASRKGKKSPP